MQPGNNMEAKLIAEQYKLPSLLPNSLFYKICKLTDFINALEYVNKIKKADKDCIDTSLYYRGQDETGKVKVKPASVGDCLLYLRNEAGEKVNIALIIPGECKARILDELSTYCGVRESFLFPELDHLYDKNKIKSTKGRKQEETK
jgi:hypothetical protein